MLGHERAVLAEDLHAIVRTNADINEAILVEAHAVDRITELLGRRLRGIIGRRLFIARLLAVSAPVALVRAGFGIEYDDPAIGVTVGGNHLLADGVAPHIARPPDPPRR